MDILNFWKTPLINYDNPDYQVEIKGFKVSYFKEYKTVRITFFSKLVKSFGVKNKDEAIDKAKTWLGVRL